MKIGPHWDQEEQEDVCSTLISRRHLFKPRSPGWAELHSLFYYCVLLCKQFIYCFITVSIGQRRLRTFQITCHTAFWVSESKTRVGGGVKSTLWLWVKSPEVKDEVVWKLKVYKIQQWRQGGAGQAGIKQCPRVSSSILNCLLRWRKAHLVHRDHDFNPK